jgi:hypothetical protein
MAEFAGWAQIIFASVFVILLVQIVRKLDEIAALLRKRP